MISSLLETEIPTSSFNEAAHRSGKLLQLMRKQIRKLAGYVTSRHPARSFRLTAAESKK
jgi:hypothetical protein